MKIVKAIAVAALLVGACVVAFVDPVFAAAAFDQPITQPGAQYTISTGTWAGEVLMWATTAFGGVITAAAVALILKVMKKFGVDITTVQKAQLQELVVNGINKGAAEAQKRLRGQGTIEIKNAATQIAIEYVQSHGSDTIKALGLDPNSGEVVEAIKARIETAIADPAQPTHAILDGPAPSPVVQVQPATPGATA